ncbi:hypothetical protein [Bifidobacterium tissieri]|uniref:Transmembrane protein n=1 Tax=Bifidobacterium tissieri TaxID=1630162 RepID=A0A5M9ZWU6_9BIFI|nr:hypothetical protein [Bifidobacterium tissieri]KAA8832127.1 hypothetical protein EMO89_01040 [Bifidobacterium tissieri]KAA8832258.1 hypothetical protein EM849_05920 [Bifidobacterium tissieri]
MDDTIIKSSAATMSADTPTPGIPTTPDIADVDIIGPAPAPGMTRPAETSSADDSFRPDPWPDLQNPQPAPAYMDFVRTGVVPDTVTCEAGYVDATGAEIVPTDGTADVVPATVPGNAMLARLGAPPIIGDQAPPDTDPPKRRLSAFAVIALMLGILCSVSFGFMGMMASYLVGIGHRGTASLVALSTIATVTSWLVIRPSGIGALITGIAGILECIIPHPRTRQRAHGWWLGLIGMVISVMPMLAVALLKSLALI